MGEGGGGGKRKEKRKRVNGENGNGRSGSRRRAYGRPAVGMGIWKDGVGGRFQIRVL